MHILDLITTKDDLGHKELSLTECSAFLLVVVPTGIALHSYITGNVWPYLPEYCFYSFGAGVGIKGMKGGVNTINSYYNARQYQNNQGGRTY